MKEFDIRILLTIYSKANKIIYSKINKEMVNIVIHSIQKWIPFEEILDNGVIKLKNNYYIMIIKVKPINYNLKTDLEKEAILNSYKIFFKTCNFDIQIIIQSQKEDLSDHLAKIQKIKEKEDEQIKNIIKKYIKNIKELNSQNKSDSKQFYILINQFQNNNEKDICIEQLNEKYFKIKEALSRCGNKVYSVNSEKEVKEILKKYFLLKNNFNK